MPRIVYLSWPAGEIAGGIKVAFQHADLLRAAGHEAVVATPDGMPPGWFATNVPVERLEAVRGDDVLVFPENNPSLFARFASSSQRKLVFCQNPHYVFQGLAGRLTYADWGVSALLCPSRNVVEFARRRFPELRAFHTPFFVDTERFRPAPKVMQVACIPRKRTLEFGAIHDVVRAADPSLREVRWNALQGATEEQVARVLGGSAVYLSLARLEAHSLAILEAMASGCIVAGFVGVPGGSDSSTPQNGLWAAEDDVQGCAERLVEALRIAREGGPKRDALVEAARATAATWGREASAQALLAAWEQVLG
jgi:glycosyltransferase involved in cell wall biosynthesis